MPSITKVDSSYEGSSPVTPGSAVPKGKALLIVTTVAGNVSLNFQDGTTVIVSVAVGTTILPFQVIQVNTTGTTATATYYNLFESK